MWRDALIFCAGLSVGAVMGLVVLSLLIAGDEDRDDIDALP